MNIKKQIHFSTNMGRMGNQMFQYACAKELSEHYGFVTSLSHLDKLTFFKLGRGERFLNKLKSVLFYRVFLKIWGKRKIHTNANCLIRSYIDDFQNIKSPTTVWGFFQSENYFIHSVASVQKAFQVKEKYTKGFEHFLKQNNLEKGKFLAVHLRRTDYNGFTIPVLEGNDFTLPVSYYNRALAELSKSNQMPIVFVSDDPDSIDSIFPNICNKIISKNDAITDFLIIKNAGQLVISNSTFAWWAAYLNGCVQLILCPKYFLGFKEQKEVPINIYPKHWKEVDVL